MEDMGIPEFDLSALFGPKPVFVTRPQIVAALELLDSYENGLAVGLLNEGEGTASARVVAGTSYADALPVASTEIVIGAAGGVFPVGMTDEDEGDVYAEKFDAAYEKAAAENPLPDTVAAAA